AEDGIRDRNVTGVQTCALPISAVRAASLAWKVAGALTPVILHTSRVLTRRGPATRCRVTGPRRQVCCASALEVRDHVRVLLEEQIGRASCRESGEGEWLGVYGE